MKFRKAVTSDLPVIRRLLKSSFSVIYAYFAFKSFSHLRQTLAAIDHDRLIGIINWKLIRVGDIKAGYLFWLAVAPEYRRKGLGSTLSRKAMRTIRSELGHCPIYAATEKANRKAHKLILKMGFKKVGQDTLKKEFGRHLGYVKREMNLMPWEDLYESKESV